jgi:alpha-beta hydrolase superfamily lysophospholipase
MNADAIEGAVAAGADSQVPLYFLSDKHALFAWLHQSSHASSCEWGVVLCKPFGYEALCGHRSLRTFASTAAELGIPTLRFDYQGTGDSADIDPNADQIEAWTRDIVHAATELRRRTGVTRICLMGFRLGALLAVQAARQCEAGALVLIAPVLSGRRYLREVRTGELAAAAAEAASTPPSPKSPSSASTQGFMEVNGYPLSGATMSSLPRIEGSATDVAGVTNLLLIDRNDLPVARDWVAAAEAAGVRTEYRVLPGFVEMLMTAPQFAKLSEEMLGATREWLSRHCASRIEPKGASGVARSEAADDPPPGRQLILPGEDDSPREQIRERPVFIDADALLFGIVTEPRQDELRRRAVILLNIGADYHIGASRMYVSLARRWARSGYFVLRVDLAGLGDSGTRQGRPDNQVFPPDALTDIRVVVEFMCARYGIRDVTLAGLCSGAYHALRAAAAGLPLNRLLMVNPQNYYWDEGMSIAGLQLAEVVRNPVIYRERIFSAAAWRRFLTGRVNIWRIVKIYLRRPLLALESWSRNFSRSVGIRLRRDLARDLQGIVDRGVSVVFVFARGEPGIDLLKIEAGSTLKRLGEGCRIRIIDSADHTFSRSGPRQVLEGILSEELFARWPPGSPSSKGLERVHSV